MRITHAAFEALAADSRSWPLEGPPEIAIAGRSNVGKSSVINALVGRRGLARTSSTPGRTRGLVFFRLEGENSPPVRLVDLPGYGYARTSKQERAAWRPLVEKYIEQRPSLRGVVALIDARRGPEREETDLLTWLAELGRPAIVVLTKIDQIPKNRRLVVSERVRADLSLAHRPVLFSVLEGLGPKELWRALAPLMSL